MTRWDESELDLGPETTERDRASLIAMAERLERERPICAPGFRGDLRRSLTADLGGRPERPPRLKAMIFAYAGSGLVLLAIAALGVGGIGPLAAG